MAGRKKIGWGCRTMSRSLCVTATVYWLMACEVTTWKVKRLFGRSLANRTELDGAHWQTLECNDESLI